MTLNKTLIAGLVALAAASSAQAVTVAANDGWELGISGSVNQFLTYESNDVTGTDEAALQNGLLPAFLNFDFKAPTMNGLDIAAHISFSPSTNLSSYAAFEQREVYFTVSGGFGQILAGKALGLYGAKNILTDQTLFGVGYGAGTGAGSTTLGGIGLGYDYAAWRSQVKWTSNDMNGFKVAFAVMDPTVGALALAGGKPTGSLQNDNVSSDNLRYEAELSYAGAFDGGSFTTWLSGMTQGEDNAGNNDTDAYSVGGTLKVGGFEAMAQYSDASSDAAAIGASAAVASTGAGDLGTAAVTAVAATETEWSQYLVQAGYRFAGATLVSAQYAELEDDNATVNDTIDKMTIGVYHDVNANLKLVAEYTKVEDDDSTVDTDIISIGGFVFF